jgi:hypothetical protein
MVKLYKKSYASTLTNRIVQDMFVRVGGNYGSKIDFEA